MADLEDGAVSRQLAGTVGALALKMARLYSYTGGINRKAMIALVVAVLPVIPGFVRAAMTPGGVVPNPTFFDHLYTYAWFVTFALSAAIYLALMRRHK